MLTEDRPPAVVGLLLQPLADGGLASESETTTVVHPDEFEGLQPVVIPAGGRILLRLRAVANWLWSPGQVPEAVALPEALFATSDLRASPDGEWIAGKAGQDGTIVLWSPATGAAREISSTAIGQYHDVAGWTQDGSRIIVSRDPTSTFACDWVGWMALVDPQTGEVSDFGSDLLAAVGTVHGLVETSVASGVAAYLDDQGQVQLLERCSDAHSDDHLDLGGPTRALDLEWSSDGMRLYVLAVDVDSPTIIEFRYDPSRRLVRIGDWDMAGDPTAIDAVDDSGRWFVIRHETDIFCPDHDIIDIGRGSTWALPCGRYLPVWVP